MKAVAIVQARLGSVRFPNKVMKPILSRPMIELLLSRLKKSKELDQIVLATSMDPINNILVDHLNHLGIDSFLGSENDVLKRYYDAAVNYHADIIVRITGDCPIVDSEIVDECIRNFKEKNVDYLSNVFPPTYPDGLDVEVFKFSTLQSANTLATDTFDREHVTSFIHKSDKFSKANLENNEDLSQLRLTVDYQEDFEVIKNIFNFFADNIYFGWKDVIDLKNKKPELFKVNENIKRNIGHKMNKGQKLWERAKKIIPGGNMLLSKRPEMFLPEFWPAYFSKSKGCRVWDLDNKEYLDMSIMGIGTNILGYGHPEVDEAVLKTINLGNMSTFNCPEEVYLAEKLIEMHPWANKARFARSGGEANSIAIRIARAFSGKDNVAICGYHGWHDWYLSANLNHNKNLDGHLLPGLEPRGVPRNLTGTVFPFAYNDFEKLERIIKMHDIGVIKMEVSRQTEPKKNFLENIRKLATKNNIILIFDECSSGFRETYGGLHKKYSIEPDLAMFGKALGNGYAITAVIGREEIMDAAQTTFISSTFWTERIGPSAALKTLEVMNREKSWEVITKKGKKIQEKWKVLANKYSVKISIWGIPALAGFNFLSHNHLEYKTLITQEMLSHGILAGNSIYVSTEHKEDDIENYFEKLDSIFSLISDCENGLDVKRLLKGQVCHSGFKRLT